MLRPPEEQHGDDEHHSPLAFVPPEPQHKKHNKMPPPVTGQMHTADELRAELEREGRGMKRAREHAQTTQAQSAASSSAPQANIVIRRDRSVSLERKEGVWL